MMSDSDINDGCAYDKAGDKCAMVMMIFVRVVHEISR